MSRSILVVFILLILFFGISSQWWRTDVRLKELERRLAVVPSPSTDPKSGVPFRREAEDTRLRDLMTLSDNLDRKVRILEKELADLKESGSTAGFEQSLGSGYSPLADVQPWNGGPKRGWGHEQAAGPPNTGSAGDLPSAWAPKNQNGGEEWLELKYDEVVDLSQINIVESHNPGAISKVMAIGEDGKEQVVWEGTMDPSEMDELVTSEFPLAETFRANKLKVYLETTRVAGWNEIDAVEMVGSDGKKQWASGSHASSSFAD